MRIRAGTSLAMAICLASCGGGEGASPATAASAPVVVSPPAPAPSPVASPTPIPSPMPSPAPSPASAATIEPYLLGSLGYTLDPGIPADKLPAIRDAMEFAVTHTNTLGAFAGNIWVTYGAGTPTADASYRGQIRFGGMIGRRVALHELAHWFGSGSTDNWDHNVSGGRFTGVRTAARIRAFEGAQAFLSADRQHFWPYGLNYDNEFSETQRNTQILSAQIADMGLGDDVTAAVAGTRRFQNRSSGHVLLAGAGGGVPTEGASTTATTQRWRVDFADGFVTLSNIADGRVIEASGDGDNVSAVMATATGAATQQWEMKPTGDGWFLLCNRATRNCLDNIGELTADAPVRLWGQSWHPNQQWRLIR